MGYFSDSEIAVFQRSFYVWSPILSPNPALRVTLQGEGPGPAGPYWREKGKQAKPRSKLHSKVAYELFCNLEPIFSQKQIYIAWSGLRVTHKAFYLGYFQLSDYLKPQLLLSCFGEFPICEALGWAVAALSPSRSQQVHICPSLPLWQPKRRQIPEPGPQT